MIRNNLKDPKICPDGFQDRLVVMTGATSGIGYVTAHKYASKGANLLCINRNPEKSENLRAEIEGKYGVKCDYLIADLSRREDIFRVSRELLHLSLPIDVLIHNAGVYLTKRELTSDGFEYVFAVHYLAPFIMTYLLMDKLMAQDQARVILVGSEGHRFAAWGLRLDDLNWEKRRYSGLKSYGSAKTAQLLAMMCFHERFVDSAVTINTMHPGAVKSDSGQSNGLVYRWIKRNILDKALRQPEISAEALYYLGVSSDLDGVSGRFYNLTTEEKPAPPAVDREVAIKLWEETLNMTAVKDYEENM